MGQNGLSDKSIVRLPVLLLVSLMVGAVSFTGGAVVSAFRQRQAIIDEVTLSRHAELSHYMTREEYLKSERERDAALYRIEKALGRLEDRLNARR